LISSAERTRANSKELAAIAIPRTIALFSSGQADADIAKFDGNRILKKPVKISLPRTVDST
jgi:hypothetical protein